MHAFTVDDFLSTLREADVRLLLAVARDFRAAHPGARPLLIGDLSRPHGGDFDRQFGYSQDLVDRFVRAAATKVFVGPGTGLTGPPDVVQVIADHDDHLHVRIAPSA